MMKTVRLFITLVFFLFFMWACTRVVPTASAPKTSAPTITATLPGVPPPGQSTHALAHDGLERSYILYAPTSIDWVYPIPLVFVFHGAMSNAQAAVQMSGFNEIAEQH